MWMISAFLFYHSINFLEANVDYLQHPVKSCHIGDVVENECNKCLCTSKTVFECNPVDCNRNKNQKEVESSKQLCYPNQLYVQNLITCICTKDGRWPHKSCQETFQSLPPSNVVKYKCTPDTYVVIDCNVCRCGPDGEIIGDRCTRNACEDDNKRRINMGPNSVYSSCEIKNWYSLAPCQFCFCVNQNKLVCNTGNYYSKKLELGSYNLRVCGKDLIREAIELIPDNQRVLRYGYAENATTLPESKNRAVTATTDMVIRLREDQQYGIEVNREGNENKTQALGQDQGQDQNQDQGQDQGPDQGPDQGTDQGPDQGPDQGQDQRQDQRQAPAQANAVAQAPTVQAQMPPPLVDENSSYDREEYYSDSEEVPKQGTSITSAPTEATTAAAAKETEKEEQEELRGASTMFPFEEGDEMLNESKMDNTDEDNDEDSNEIDVEMGQNSTPPGTPQNGLQYNMHALNDENQKQLNAELQQMAREGKSGESYQYVGNTLKINLPKVLNKVFQLALRKSMVSISNETKCVPGTTNMNDCNMCFCLKNSKLLCTNNSCKDKAQ